MSQNNEQHSLPSNSLGARISPPDSTPKSTPRSEGTPKPPTHPGYKSNWRDLTPSEAPVLGLASASNIANGVAAAINQEDRRQAVINGMSEDEFNQRRLLAELAQAVRGGTLSEHDAKLTWIAAFPSVDPSSIGGGQS